jgi:hypothetical protein
LFSLVRAIVKQLTTNPTPLEQFALNFFEPVVIGISVSFLIVLVQNILKGDAIDRRLYQYEDVLNAVEMLQNARRNNGLAGISNRLGEKEKFEEIIDRAESDMNPPTIWWMNFRIERYDTFVSCIESLVKSGGKVYLVTSHYENPNIEFRLEEAYAEHGKSLDDYRQHFILQARAFIRLERKLASSSGEFKVYFNRGSPGVPIFVESHNLDYRAYSGFYLIEKSGDLPYVLWETAGEGMVRRFIRYIEFKMSSSISAEEMALDPNICSENDTENLLDSVNQQNQYNADSQE